MTDAGYVLTGWALTAAVLAAYFARVSQRTRRAQRSLAHPEAGDGGRRR